MGDMAVADSAGKRRSNIRRATNNARTENVSGNFMSISLSAFSGEPLV
jgi:hypothetical protein